MKFSSYPKLKTPFLFLCVLFTGLFAQWDTYPTYAEYVSIMDKFENDYPELCKIVDLGTSVRGRKLLAVKVSDNVNEDEKEAAFLYLSTIHGDETVGFILMLRLIDHMCSKYGEDELITKLVDRVEIFISPLGNPDGLYERPGVSVHMNYNERDLNHNFPCACMQGNHRYYGVYDSLEPETKAFIDLFNSQSFVIGADIHSGAECAIWPYAGIDRLPADHAWYKMVAEQYRDSAQANSPSGYFDYNGGAINYYNGLYESHGTIIDCLAYYKYCRAFHLELCDRKMPVDSTLPVYWGYNYKSLLNYIEQVLFGISGTVTDTLTGEPLNVKVFIEGHDKDSSHVYSHLPHGDFYRPVYEGIYDITFSREDYQSKTIKGVQVEKNKATILNVELYNGISINPSDYNKNQDISINISKEGFLIKSNHPVNNNWKIKIYDLMGRELESLPVKKGFIKWNKGNGAYIVKFVGKDINKQFKVVFTK